MSTAPRRPTAFRLDDIRLSNEEPDPFDLPTAEPAPAPPRRRRHLWSRLFFSAAGALLALAFGLAVDRLVRSLFERTDWLGWVGLGLTALAVMALFVLAAREVVGLVRLRFIGRIQAVAAEAIAEDSRDKAKAACRELVALYAPRPETAHGRAALDGHLREIIDGRDLIGLAETELMLPLDETARRMVMESARRVSVVTAISPRALVDVLFVLTEILRLIRRLGTLYGGRPGMFGFWRLTRKAVGHLAVTGGMAAGESLFQQVLGHGIAARISTRLGEGVINGILTARVGIAAIEVCRPLPFTFARPTRLADVIAELTRKAEKEDAET
ncbi:MAG: TIGR01620 family protein [Bauldia sp.]|nr:TIGR01620 family protein [Bauldia sp.]